MAGRFVSLCVPASVVVLPPAFCVTASVVVLSLDDDFVSLSPLPAFVLTEDLPNAVLFFAVFSFFLPLATAVDASDFLPAASLVSLSTHAVCAVSPSFLSRSMNTRLSVMTSSTAAIADVIINIFFLSSFFVSFIRFVPLYISSLYSTSDYMIHALRVFVKLLYLFP